MDTWERSIVHVEPGEGPVARMPGLGWVVGKVGSGQTGGAYALFEVTVPPGGGEGMHIQHREDECFWVLRGRFELTDDTGPFAVGPGSLVYVPHGSAHALQNVGPTSGSLLVLRTPGEEHERFLEEIGGLAASRAASDARTEAGELAAVAAGFGIEMVSPL